MTELFPTFLYVRYFTLHWHISRNTYLDFPLFSMPPISSYPICRMYSQRVVALSNSRNSSHLPIQWQTTLPYSELLFLGASCAEPVLVSGVWIQTEPVVKSQCCMLNVNLLRWPKCNSFKLKLYLFKMENSITLLCFLIGNRRDLSMYSSRDATNKHWHFSERTSKLTHTEYWYNESSIRGV